ncbi:hypothetical protein J2X57_000772 [Luteibacter sp. 1214]|uniref:hypothetical protein n=1 Tax=Luteibacter sp. 1214 TaxID=2817735 RepID=UPI00285AB602|nr:hypothetical protein [Luteibacter sp. 1214]MDR6641578.1 hypothetical protein [Luteibacter sp. 1214]
MAFAQETPAVRLRALENYEHARIVDQTPEDQRNHLIVAEYDRLFPYSAATLPSMSDDELRSAFSASYLAAFFAMDRRLTSEVEAYLHALEQRGIVSGKDFVKMHDIFVATRMFDRANEIKTKYPDLNMEKAPTIIGRSPVRKPSRLVPTSQDDSLTYQPVNLKGRVLVVIAHPLCHFSVNAIKAISEEPALSSIFKGAVWLAPPGPRLNLPEINKWNEDHPAAPLAFMDQREDWPMFDAWATPTFYFLNNGKVVAKVEGWPPAKGMKDFYQSAARWKAAR